MQPDVYALQPRCPDPGCAAPVRANVVEIIADPGAGLLGRIRGRLFAAPVRRISLGDAAILLAPLVVLGFFVPLWIVLVLGLPVVLWISVAEFYRHAARRGGKTKLLVAHCRRCGFQWTAPRSPMATLLPRLKWDLRRAEQQGNTNLSNQMAVAVAGVTALVRDDHRTAAGMLEPVYAAEASVQGPNLALAANNLGWSLWHLEEREQAQPFAEEAVALARAQRKWQVLAPALNNLALIRAEHGRLDQAEELLCESLRLKRDMADVSLAVWGFEALAQVEARRMGSEAALRVAQLLGGAEALRQGTGDPLPPSERPAVETAVAAAQSRVDHIRWSEAWREGWAMPVAALFALGLRESHD